MTRKEMENRYHEIVMRDTTLDAQEQVALREQYIYAWDAAEIGLLAEELQHRLMKVAGVVEFLNDMGKIRDDEDLHMLMNEIEDCGYKHMDELMSGKKGS